MTARVAIRPLGVTIEAPMGSTVLSAALKAGIDFPNSCQSGNCGACKCALVAGEAEMMPYSPYALSDDERARGLILACRAMVWEDCTVSMIAPPEAASHPLQQRRASVRSIERPTHDIAIVRLVPDAPLAFSAGQFVRLDFGGGLARDYSMANRPDVGELEFHIRHIPGGEVSGHVWERLQPGDEVGIEGPHGDCWLREDHTGPIFAVAGGSGLAPIKSIVETTLARGMANDIHLYFGVRDEADVYLEQHFRALAQAHSNLHLEIVLSAPQGASKRRRGLITEALKADHPEAGGAKAYVCGPPVMVEAAMALFETWGLPASDRHADAFVTRAEAVGQGAA